MSYVFCLRSSMQNSRMDFFPALALQTTVYANPIRTPKNLSRSNFGGASLLTAPSQRRIVLRLDFWSIEVQERYYFPTESSRTLVLEMTASRLHQCEILGPLKVTKLAKPPHRKLQRPLQCLLVHKSSSVVALLYWFHPFCP